MLIIYLFVIIGKRNIRRSLSKDSVNSFPKLDIKENQIYQDKKIIYEFFGLFKSNITNKDFNYNIFIKNVLSEKNSRKYSTLFKFLFYNVSKIDNLLANIIDDENKNLVEVDILKNFLKTFIDKEKRSNYNIFSCNHSMDEEPITTDTNLFYCDIWKKIENKFSDIIRNSIVFSKNMYLYDNNKNRIVNIYSDILYLPYINPYFAYENLPFINYLLNNRNQESHINYPYFIFKLFQNKNKVAPSYEYNLLNKKLKDMDKENKYGGKIFKLKNFESKSILESFESYFLKNIKSIENYISYLYITKKKDDILMLSINNLNVVKYNNALFSKFDYSLNLIYNKEIHKENSDFYKNEEFLKKEINNFNRIFDSKNYLTKSFWVNYYKKFFFFTKKKDVFEELYNEIFSDNKNDHYVYQKIIAYINNILFETDNTINLKTEELYKIDTYISLLGNNIQSIKPPIKENSLNFSNFEIVSYIFYDYLLKKISGGFLEKFKKLLKNFTDNMKNWVLTMQLAPGKAAFVILKELLILTRIFTTIPTCMLFPKFVYNFVSGNNFISHIPDFINYYEIFFDFQLFFRFNLLENNDNNSKKEEFILNYYENLEKYNSGEVKDLIDSFQKEENNKEIIPNKDKLKIN